MFFSIGSASGALSEAAQAAMIMMVIACNYFSFVALALLRLVFKELDTITESLDKVQE